MVTGMGLGDALRRKGPRWLMFFGAVGLLAANTINMGADLSAMADAAEMLSGINSHIYVVIFGIAITYATARFRYHQIAMIMKWLAAVLFGYVITAFIAGPGLVDGAARYLYSFVAAESCGVGKPRRSSRHDH